MYLVTVTSVGTLTLFEKITPPPCILFPDPSVAVPVLCAALFPMDLRVGERGMRPGSDTALFTPLHPPLLLTQFSSPPCASFSQQHLHQQIRVHDLKHVELGKSSLCKNNCLNKNSRSKFLRKILYIIFANQLSYMTIYFMHVAVI